MTRKHRSDAKKKRKRSDTPSRAPRGGLQVLTGSMSDQVITVRFGIFLVQSLTGKIRGDDSQSYDLAATVVNSNPL